MLSKLDYPFYFKYITILLILSFEVGYTTKKDKYDKKPKHYKKEYELK